MNDALGKHAPHLQADLEAEPNGGLRVAALAVLLTMLAALILVGLLCL